MDVLEFAQKYSRMCSAFETCMDGCPAKCVPCGDISDITQALVDVVEKWSEEHPIRTRRTEFLKYYPNADVDYLDPCYLEKSLKNSCSDKDCAICRKEYWSEEVE